MNNLQYIVTVNTNKQLSCVNHDTISGVLMNCRSVTNKTQEIQVELTNNNLDVCVLTEMWIKEDDNVTPMQGCAQMDTSPCLSPDQTEQVEASLLSSRRTSMSQKHALPLTLPWKWLHSRLTLKTMSSIWSQTIVLQTPTYWTSAVNSQTYLSNTLTKVESWC